MTARHANDPIGESHRNEPRINSLQTNLVNQWSTVAMQMVADLATRFRWSESNTETFKYGDDARFAAPKLPTN
jgi:hypothetical protein